MTRMPDETYNKFYKMVRDMNWTKESLQQFYDSEIKWRYSDWKEMLKLLFFCA